ncbi:MAG TPA: riboflavin synthase [Xanthobacteraceae bacterium]|nr:riboflavin synthase [Xanthobacteraceae bacterium]
MFTGLVSDVGEIVAVSDRAEGLRRLKIACHYRVDSLGEGASIACAGVCLTVVGSGEEGNRAWFLADAAAETLRLTTASRWQVGTRINLERPLRIGDELGGHLVAGHVDGVATVTARAQMPEMTRFELQAPHALARFIASKGSVALDGVSLTVNDVAGDAFSVLIIPHTLKVTTLAALDVGSAVNLEVDLMARYAARLAEAR